MAMRARPAFGDNAPVAFQLPSPFSDVLAGTIPGVSILPIVRRKTDPVQEFVVSNLDGIAASGLEIHETNAAITVLYNPHKVTHEQIDAAEKAGKLLELFPAVKQFSTPSRVTRLQNVELRFHCGNEDVDCSAELSPAVWRTILAGHKATSKGISVYEGKKSPITIFFNEGRIGELLILSDDGTEHIALISERSDEAEP